MAEVSGGLILLFNRYLSFWWDILPGPGPGVAGICKTSWILRGLFLQCRLYIRAQLGVGSVDLHGILGVAICVSYFHFLALCYRHSNFPSNKVKGNSLLTHLRICYPFEFFSRRGKDEEPS